MDKFQVLKEWLVQLNKPENKITVGVYENGVEVSSYEKIVKNTNIVKIKQKN